jgi:uncharacterized protein YecA (UPF0149 family)
MGAIAEAFVAYAQPLLDQTDGSEEDLNRAIALSQLCYNLALLPDESREQSIVEMRLRLDMDDAEFDDFKRSILIPMIQRHEEMFPMLHRRGSINVTQSEPWPPMRPRTAAPAKASPEVDRYAPCPCNSGLKYKFCCGKKRR